jgi:multidrug transporter EmrE-like cation transporter
MSAYWYLFIAIVTEVIATSALKSAEEFTRFCRACCDRLSLSYNAIYS